MDAAAVLQAGVWRPAWHCPCCLGWVEGGLQGRPALGRGGDYPAGCRAWGDIQPGREAGLHGDGGGEWMGWGLLRLWNTLTPSSEQGTQWRSVPSTAEGWALGTGRSLGSGSSSLCQLTE